MAFTTIIVEFSFRYRQLNSTIIVAPDNRLRCDAAYVLMNLERLLPRPMSSQLVVVGSILRQDPAQVRFAQDDHMVNALATIDPMSLSAKPFCQGEPGR